MTFVPSSITAIIFDLGGVIVDVSVEKTVEAFSNVSGLQKDDIRKAYVQYPGFFSYERGEISDEEFRFMLRKIFSLQTSDKAIDECWNAMLLGLPMGKLQLVEKIKSTLPVYVLSNTNTIHIEYINKHFLKGQSLDAHFLKCYYSHEVGMRKPEPGIYDHVLQDANLVADKTLFLDDNAENLMAAKALGIQTMHVTHPDMVFDLLK